MGGCQIPQSRLGLLFIEAFHLPKDLMFARACLEDMVGRRHALCVQDAIDGLLAADIHVQVNVPDHVDIRLRATRSALSKGVWRQVHIAAVRIRRAKHALKLWRCDLLGRLEIVSDPSGVAVGKALERDYREAVIPVEIGSQEIPRDATTFVIFGATLLGLMKSPERLSVF